LPPSLDELFLTNYRTDTPVARGCPLMPGYWNCPVLSLRTARAQVLAWPLAVVVLTATTAATLNGMYPDQARPRRLRRRVRRHGLQPRPSRAAAMT
jgi:hypothetical protein